MLSPYRRRRLITEREVIATALRTHGPESASKFVEDVSHSPFMWTGSGVN